MVAHRSNKKKRFINLRSTVQREPRSLRSDIQSIKENRDNSGKTHDHPYATRSKTLRESISTFNLSNLATISRESSDTSVEYLGAFRKVPQLINLEDNNEEEEIERNIIIQQPDLWFSQETKAVRLLQDKCD